jgi:uncharacterized protein (TIGR02594 family)
MEAVKGLEAAHIVGHGILGGATNAAMGGKFQDGFLSAAASSGASRLPFADGSRLSRTVKAGVIGGTASALGGGKFANGAYTSAFQHLLNEETSSVLKAIRINYAEDLLEIARNEHGIHENINPDRVREYHNTASAKGSGPGTAWCGSFISWIFNQVGLGGAPTGSSWAQNWTKWGSPVDSPALGAIAVFRKTDGTGHVTFVAGTTTDGRIIGLGGNQNDSVKYSAYFTNTKFTTENPTMKLLGYRVPNFPNRALIVPPIMNFAGSRTLDKDR